MYDINQVKSVYDELTAKVKVDLDEQFNLGRLKGSDYTEVYAKLMDECLQLAFKAPVEEQQTINLLKDLDVKNSQIEVNNEEIKLRQQQVASMQLDDTRKDNITNSEISLNNEEIELKTQQIASIQKDDVRKDNITNKELALKDEQIASSKNNDAINLAQSDKDLLVKQTQIDEMNKKILLMSQEITSMVNKDDREASMLTTDTALKNAEVATQIRQKQGFDDNMKLKLFESQINAWSMMFSSGMLDTAPAIISNDEVKELYCKMMDELGLCSYDDCENRNP